MSKFAANLTMLFTELPFLERFAAALPVQVLKGMAPLLMPYLQPGTHTQCMAGS